MMTVRMMIVENYYGDDNDIDIAVDPWSCFCSQFRRQCHPQIRKMPLREPAKRASKLTFASDQPQNRSTYLSLLLFFCSCFGFGVRLDLRFSVCLRYVCVLGLAFFVHVFFLGLVLVRSLSQFCSWASLQSWCLYGFSYWSCFRFMFSWSWCIAGFGFVLGLAFFEVLVLVLI